MSFIFIISIKRKKSDCYSKYLYCSVTRGIVITVGDGFTNSAFPTHRKSVQSMFVMPARKVKQNPKRQQLQSERTPKHTETQQQQSLRDVTLQHLREILPQPLALVLNLHRIKAMCQMSTTFYRYQYASKSAMVAPAHSRNLEKALKMNL